MDGKELQELLQEYDTLLASQKFVDAELDYGVLNYHIPLLQKLDVIGSSSMYIIDLHKRNYVYVSPRFYQVFGFDIEEAYEEGPSFLDRRVHPDDFINILQIGNYFMRFALSLPSEKLREFKLVIDYRLKNSRHEYMRVLKQYIPLELDTRGNMWLTLCMIDVSPSDLDAPVRSRLINVQTGALYHFPPENTSMAPVKLSGREQQILQLIANGLISKQIADELFISVNTVNTHRQRIIEKLNVTNTFEAVKYASDLGLLR